RKGLDNAGATIIESRAVLEDAHTVRIVAENRTVTAETILIATGGHPSLHPALPGSEYCITSNEAFHLEELPKAIVIAGGGYIGVEFANIFHGLGVETTLIYRGKEILGRFDKDLRTALHVEMEAKGIKILCGEIFSRIEKRADGRLDAHTSADRVVTADQIMLAIGRKPNTDGLGLDAAGVKVGPRGEVVVDDYSRTNVDNIYAIGDVTDRVQLTPVAIHEAMCLIDTLYRGTPTKPDHETIATAVFSQPELGTVGLSEDDAAKKYDELEIYMATFRPMRHTLSGRMEKMVMKLVVDAATRKVVGAHVLGVDAGEMAQLLGIAVKAGLTKEDFDRTTAVHPTAAEELVTMYKPSYRVKDGKRFD
ncbi:MAG: FAD-dependent oxidoreductase, partial [Aliihoeflea sp.]